MRFFRRRPRSPALVLLLLRPLLASSGASVPGSQPRAMNAGGGARGYCPRLQRSTVPGSDPQRCNELLLLAAGDEAALEPRHHVLYFPGDVQVTRGPGLPDTPTRVVTREAGGVCWGGGRDLWRPRSVCRSRRRWGRGKERRCREWDTLAQLQPVWDDGVRAGHGALFGKRLLTKIQPLIRY